MTKTFDQSLTDTCNISMSMLDKADVIQVGSEEYDTLRREQQGCHNDLTNRYDYPFNLATTTISTVIGTTEYNGVNGRIKGIIQNDTKYVLKYNPKSYLNIDRTGRPEEYRETYNPDKIVLYPTPDAVYDLTVNYYDSANVSDSEGNPSYIITADSTLRMPERLQHLYFDALEYYLLATHIKKLSNPRYQPLLNIFAERWSIFLNNCSQTTEATRFII